MTRPNLSLKVEPIVSGKVTYLPLAAATTDDQSTVKIVLRLDITNNYSDRNVEVTGIKFSFPSSSVEMKKVNHYDNMNIGPLMTATWSNGLVDLNPDEDIKDMWNN